MAGPLKGESPKIGERKKLSNSVSGYLKNKKIIWPLSPRGGGGEGLNDPAIKKITFFAASINAYFEKGL